MKKIMFNDRYGLHDAVMNGTKTMTRRIVPQSVLDAVKDYQEKYYAATLSSISVEDAILNMVGPERMFNCAFQIGEIVAIAQRYKDMALHVYDKRLVRLDKEDGTEPEPLDRLDTLLYLQSLKGFNNKMFVKAEWMPHHIKITGIHVERLQDISDEDCLKEGIFYDKEGGSVIGWPFAVPFYYAFQGNKSKETGKLLHYSRVRDAFLTLIDKVSGKGIWKSNPLVFVYEFERID